MEKSRKVDHEIPNGKQKMISIRGVNPQCQDYLIHDEDFEKY